MMKAVVKKIIFPNKGRIICISDIHGNIDLLKRLLIKINYTSNDVMVIVGDLIEKGPKSLETLRYIIELSRTSTIYAVSGNCDTIWEDIKSDVDDSLLLKYMLARQSCILNQMCEELEIKVSPEADMSYIREKILLSFSEELSWLESLPHIIESDKLIFAHAGLNSSDFSELNAWSVMKNDAFMEKGISFSKYLIVGHWPVVNYGKRYASCNPIINVEQRIISIDGGNVIKSDGQLNAFIICDNDIEAAYFESIDELPVGVIAEDQSSSRDSIFISWNDNKVEVLEEKEEFTLCRHKSSEHKLWIKNTKLFRDKDEMRCYDCTDYFLSVSKGDIIAIIERGSKQTLVKKSGVIGWVLNEKINVRGVINT